MDIAGSVEPASACRARLSHPELWWCNATETRRVASIERCLRCPAALAAVQRNEASAPHVELLLLRDPPLVKAAPAQCLTFGAFYG